ncbi:MAG: sulfatase [Planctomycetaceae bacterium]|nr:sulfatase [Planctomycetaceae bacterium]
MSRYSFLLILLPLILGSQTSSSLAAEDKLNVLFIAVDDLGNVLDRDRPAGIKTPHLDELKERGVFFQRAYCQIPLCNPSRASVMTGKRPDATTVWDLDRHFRDQIPDAVTLSQQFRQRDYQVARVGKIYHYNVPKGIGTDGLDDKPSWDKVINPKGRDVAEEALITNPTPWKPVSAAMSWLEADGTDEEQTDGMIATEAIGLLKEFQEQPFFLAVGFFRPHTPYVAPKKYFEMHPLEEIRLEEVPQGDRDDIPAAAIPHNIPKPDYGLETEILKNSLQAYYASVSFVDAQVGRVVAELDRLNLSDNTVIVFWSDHGYHLGEHHLWQKRTLYDESARAPVIIAAPGLDTAGTTCNRVVEFIDIYPTVTDLVFGTVPKDIDGRSLKPLLDDPQQKWRHPAFTQILRPGDGKPVMGSAITLGRYRYVEWNGGSAGRELFDHRTDPRELTNLVDSPDHQQIIHRLQKRLHENISTDVPETPFNPKRL